MYGKLLSQYIGLSSSSCAVLAAVENFMYLQRKEVIFRFDSYVNDCVAMVCYVTAVKDRNIFIRVRRIVNII